ncbi:ATP-binding protein [Mesorhizobium sp. USDA-HM6]|nr:ATP-binding protein [Mesorhizobium sp. USDA-HM6]
MIKTDRGEVYVQAKRTISLSPSSSNELASVADQFVRQYHHGIVEAGARRDFDPSRDRLVLAVGATTPATVRDNLREALDRTRTGAATNLPHHLSSALEVFAGLTDAAWNTHAGKAISSTERQAILSTCSVVSVGEAQRQVVEEGLRDVTIAGDESTLVESLISWAAAASGNGTGGDAAAIRLALTGKARLVEPPSYRNDVQRLNAYTTGVMRRLERFTEVASPEGRFTIVRPVTALAAKAAREGPLAITGEPGSGKSAVVHGVAQELAIDATVVVLTVEASSVSLDALRVEIGLQHSLVDVLAQMPGDRPAYLILDALDAARGELAEATYKRLVEKVSALPGWNVIASVRIFDLRLGREWRRLFTGTAPLTEYADRNFSAVRHIHVGLFSDGEKADVAAKSPILAAAIEAGGPKMEALARNPFNLALLGDLLQGGVVASTLSSLATRGELLERYWDERISELGLPAVTSLKSVMTRMLAARSIDIPETDVPDTAAKAVDELQHVGVLVTEQTRRIGF